MFERVARLHEALTGADKAEIGLLQNAYVEWTHTYTREKTAANRKEWMSAKEALAEAVQRLWPQAFPGEAAKTPAETGPVFKDKAAAFAWYVENGGQRQKSSFYQVIPADGKRVSRLAVSEMLRKERPAAAPVDLAGRKELADTEKAEADARSAKVRADEAERERDARWMLREDAEDQSAALVGLIQDAFRHRVYLDHHPLLLAAGGPVGKASELAHALQMFVDRAFNDVAAYKEIDVEFEGEDDD
jgi:hypothetical protein